VIETRWGITVPFAGVPLDEHPELLAHVEALGYHDVWSSETPAGTDGFTTLALAAPVTERLRLATGIVNPFTRGPAVLAQTAAALQEASGGRFVLGIGSSSDVVVERFNGMTFEKPLTRVREAVESLRPVLSVPAGKGFGGLRLERPVTEPVPIVLAALRAKMLGLAGELADGAFTNFLPLSGLPQVVAAHRAGGAGELACRFFIIPGDPDAGMETARRMFTAYGSVPVYAAFFRWLGWAEQLDPMVQAYTSGDRDRALAVAPEELIREIFLLGSTDEIRARLQQFVDGGITTVVLAPMGEPPATLELLEALAPGNLGE